MSLRYINGNSVEFLDVLFFLVTFHALNSTAIVSENEVLNNRLICGELHFGIKIECFIFRQLIKDIVFRWLNLGHDPFTLIILSWLHPIKVIVKLTKEIL